MNWFWINGGWSSRATDPWADGISTASFEFLVNLARSVRSINLNTLTSFSDSFVFLHSAQVTARAVPTWLPGLGALYLVDVPGVSSRESDTRHDQ